MKTPFTATNWSDIGDNFSETFYSQYTSQFWLPEEIPVSQDLNSWAGLEEEERWVYIHASAGLNALDTLQGEVGMPFLKDATEGHVRKAVIQFQGMMEDIHAKSYSMMNKTFLSSSDEREVFRWVEENKYIQYKIDFIKEIYSSKDTSLIGRWRKYAVSCLLETSLFYSGFFYPLYLAGNGKMTNTVEIFNLIIRDEALHGVYISLLANELYEAMDDDEKEDAVDWFIDTSHELYMNEVAYTEYLYEVLGTEVIHEVKKFVRYNFNNVTDNLAIERMFPDEEINATVKNGISTDSTTHDFFSSKGNSYGKIEIEPMRDEDFSIL